MLLKEALMRRIIVWSLSVMLALLVTPVFAQEKSTPWPTDGWQTSTPEGQGMNSQTLAAMLDTIAAHDVPIHSVLVIRNGYLVLEAYNYPYAPDDLHTVYSVTKSITSALFGIALDQGFIEGGEQKMLDFFPDYTPANLDEAKQAITLDNLLTMSPGFEWPGGMAEPLMGDMMVTDDWVQYMLDRPMRGEPGQLFVYNSGVSNLLAAIIAHATGQPLLDFAQANLFEPLGVDSAEWADDPQGRYLGGFGLQLTPRDMAKIGYLYLNNGQWDGQEIISSGWVGFSTQQHISARPLSDGYGYHWWTNVQGYYMAIGYGGQYIIVHPQQNLVVVFTSNLSVSTGSQPETYLKNFIMPAIEADEALPDNPAGVAALETAVEKLAQPVPQAVPPLPATAAQISDQEFHFAANDFGWESLTLTFNEEVAQLILDDEQPLIIGLDNVAQVNDVSNSEAIFAIGFDNILRVDPVAGAEPMLVTGSWPKDNRFVIHIELQGTVNWYQLTLTFNDQNVQVTVRNGLSGSSYSLVGSTA
jgi:CubicO group peptidase (beta-lactamase class C family)